MARLTAPRGRLSRAPARVGGAPARARAREEQRLRTRDQEAPWRSWYKTARWQRLREAVLLRDDYTCQQTGVSLTGTYPAPDSAVADHKQPHNGDPELFWDIDNVQAVSKAYHDSRKQAQEWAGRKASRHPKWLQPSLVPLTVVCGPPAAGKSTWVAENAGPHDLVIDIDVIAAQLAGTTLHGWDMDKWWDAAAFRRNHLLGELAKRADWPAAWLILTEPLAKWRAWWEEILQAREVVVLETPPDICRARAAQDADRTQAQVVDGILRWWDRYERRPGETVIRPGEGGSKVSGRPLSDPPPCLIRGFFFDGA